MAHGPGKYDHEATLVREGVGARTVLLAVIGGSRGSGFSLQTESPGDLVTLPAVLRQIADQIEADQS